MPGRPSSPYIPLPKLWNKRIRSAVLHAISLAQFALTSARGQIQRQDRVRDRRFAKIDRLRQGIHLLKEELRLKDARMLRVAGRRRLRSTSPSSASPFSREQTAQRILVTPATVVKRHPVLRIKTTPTFTHLRSTQPSL